MAIFVQIIIEESAKSKKLLQILRNLLDPQITFLKNSKIVYNPRIVVKSRKMFLKSENMFCHVLLAPAVSQR